MRAPILKADSNGKITDAGGRCVGFALIPALPVSRVGTELPGSFPVTVKIRGGEAIDVWNSDTIWLGEEVPGFAIEGCTAGDFWQVVQFRSNAEGVLRSGEKTRALVHIVDPSPLVTANPALATDGVPVRPSYRAWTFAFSGAGLGQDVEVWTRSLGGIWTVAETITPSASEAVISRSVIANGGRLYLRKTLAGALNVEIEAQTEVG